MNAATLAWRALRHKPLASSLNLLLVAIGIAMMTFILGVSSQLEEHAERDEERDVGFQIADFRLEVPWTRDLYQSEI